MKESLLSRFKSNPKIMTKNEKSTEIYSETKLKNDDESQQGFVAHIKKDEDAPTYVSRKSKKGLGTTSHIFPNSMGIAQEELSINTGDFASTRLVETEKLKASIFQLSSFTSVEKINSSLPPIVTHGAVDILKRVSPLKLRSAYYSDGMVYNWINRIVEYFLSAEPKLLCKNKSDQTIIDEWVVTNNFREMLKLQFQHKYNYGNAVWRWIDDSFGQPNNIYFIDPVFFDAVRSEDGDVKYGKDGEPKGYLQYLKSIESTEGLPKNRITFQPPQYDYQSGTALVFKKDEIMHMRLNRLGDDWWGIGQLEPTYIDILNKKNGEQGFAEALQTMGYPRLVGYSGDAEHPPTHQKMDDLFDAIDDLEADSKVVLPHYDKIEILESSKLDNVISELEYLKDSVVTGLGGPKSLVTGSGEATNRSTLQDQKLWLERSLKMEQQDTSNEIKVKLLTPLAKRLNLKDVPTLIWQEVSMESIESKIDRIVKLGKGGFINPEDPAIREFISDLEDIPISSTVQKKAIKPKLKSNRPKKQELEVTGEVNDRRKR